VPRKTFLRLLGYLRPYTWAFILGLVCVTAAAALDGFSFVLIMPMLQTLFGMEPAGGEIGRTAIERILEWVAGDFIYADAPTTALRHILILATVAILLKNAFSYLGEVLAMYQDESVWRDLRSQTFGHIERLPLSFFDREKTGQLIAKVLTDTADAKAVVGRPLWAVIRYAVSVVVYVFILVSTSWRLSLIMLALAPIVFVLYRPIVISLRRKFRRGFEQRGDMVNVLQETISGVRLVKSYGAEQHERRRFDDRSGSYTRRMIRAHALALTTSPISEVIGAILALSITWIGSSLVLGSGSLSAEQFILFVTVAVRLVSPIKRLAQFPATAQASLAAADRFFEVLDMEPEPVGPAGRRALTGFERDISFESVDFDYRTAHGVLRGVDLTIAKGEVVAVVGPSGAGKSTLADLIPRFMDPTRGRIAIDGVDIREFTLESLRAQMGIVSQETVIFHDTVRANIAYGAASRWSQAEVESAARVANAADFIDQLSDGYDTQLGDRGVRLSGGQRQRIGLARAILRDPPLLILDEATSSLDTESERLIQSALEALFEGRTVVVIAHRLSTVLDADRIVVLNEGRIVDIGTHAQLSERGGLYQRLFEMQFELPTAAGVTGGGFDAER
jgi:subfamily B ATP-binding cassette protein MsbA